MLHRCLRIIIAAIALIVASASAAYSQPDDANAVQTYSLHAWPRADHAGVALDAIITGTQLGLGFRAGGQQLDASRTAYSLVTYLAMSPGRNERWLRLDLGFGVAGLASDRNLRWYQRAGIGYYTAATLSPLSNHRLQPELSAWALGATSVRATGLSLGVRVMEMRTSP